MVAGQHRQRVGADLIRHVAIGRNAICTDPHRIDLALRHQAGRHRVGDQLAGNAQLRQLPGRQTAPLQQRARLPYPDVDHLAIGKGLGDYSQRRTYARGRQPTGITVRQQAAAGHHQRAARRCDASAELFILGNQPLGFGHQRRNKIYLRQGQLHAVKVVHQVHRRRARRPQRLQGLGQRGVALAPLGQQRQQQAGGEANQRRTTHPQGMNMTHQRLYPVGGQPAFLLRKRLLIENKKLIIGDAQTGGLEWLHSVKSLLR